MSLRTSLETYILTDKSRIAAESTAAEARRKAIEDMRFQQYAKRAIRSPQVVEVGGVKYIVRLLSRSGIGSFDIVYDLSYETVEVAE